MRTLYYRLLRLLSLAIQPLFIFDGPNKPPFKRNSKTHSNGASLPNYLTKQLLKFFGFPFHTAPGEAEAECALLQKKGIVDAVLSEDVDTLMFGCGLTLRNWSSEGTRGNKSPTHVSMYTTEATKQVCSLDSDGMILIALMSGGDYIPAGVPGCGIKIAHEAAKAGFGYDLCRIPRKDVVGFQQWREKLNHELKSNSSGYFRAKHKSLIIPDTFPNMTVLGYYTDPIVSTAEETVRISSAIVWNTDIDINGLRNFVAEAFEWHHLSGAQKFVRGLAPALLIRQLCQRSQTNSNSSNDLRQQEEEEKKIVAEICGRRSHFATDATPELRVSYTPNAIVKLDLTSEENDRLTTEHQSDSESNHDETPASRKVNGSKDVATQTIRSVYDPQQPEKIWILESFARIGLPLLMENWEEDMRNSKKIASRKAREKVVTKQRPIDSFLKITKPTIRREIEPDTMAFGDPIQERPSHHLEKLSIQTCNADNSSTLVGLSETISLEVSPTPSSDALPSPSTLLSPSSFKGTQMKVSFKKPISISSSPPETPKCPKGRKGLVKVRDSIAGAWKTAELWEANGSYTKSVYRDVEILDLTQS